MRAGSPARVSNFASQLSVFRVRSGRGCTCCLRAHLLLLYICGDFTPAHTSQELWRDLIDSDHDGDITDNEITKFLLDADTGKSGVRVHRNLVCEPAVGLRLRELDSFALRAHGVDTWLWRAGDISPAELTAALTKRLGDGASGLVSKTMINLADEDENGRISRIELEHLVGKLIKTNMPDWSNKSIRGSMVGHL